MMLLVLAEVEITGRYRSISILLDRPFVAWWPIKKHLGVSVWLQSCMCIHVYCIVRSPNAFSIAGFARLWRAMMYERRPSYLVADHTITFFIMLRACMPPGN